MLGHGIRAVRASLSVIFSLLLLALALPGLASPAAAAPTASLQVQKTTPGVTGPLKPGDTFTYVIQVGCSSAASQGCTAASLADVLPAPLIFDPAFTTPVAASVTGGANVTVVANPETNSFTAAPQASVNGGVGQSAGTTMTITVHTAVPTSVDGDLDGKTLTNTATATASNADDATATANVTLKVENTLAASITKTASPTSTIPAVPGRTVAWQIAAGNESTRGVDTLVVQDPAEGGPGWPAQLDFTGFGSVTAPSAATGVKIEWVDAGGTWHTSHDGAIPSDFEDGLPSDLTTVKGVRFTWTGPIARSATTGINIRTVTNSAVNDITPGTTVQVPNRASAKVSVDGSSSPVVTDDASVQISSNPPDVDITKSFADASLISGQTTTATITATNGSQAVHSLTVNEPSLGQPSFTDQGLRFNGFDDVQWPVGATGVTITYTGAGCPGTPQSATGADTLPSPPAGCTVERYSVTFTSPAGTDGIISTGYASLVQSVTAIPLTTDTPRSSTNHVDTAVENTDGQRGTDTGRADFTVDPLRVDTEAGKQIIPDQQYAVPGAHVTVSLSGKVSDSSTVGSEYLQVTDPATVPSPFWNAFTADALRTDIPGGLKLTLSYYDTATSAWVDFPGQTGITGPQSNYTYQVPAGPRDQIGGVRFTFTPIAENGLVPVGTTVLPRIDAVVRPGVPNTQQVIPNTVESEVHNPSAIVPTQTDDDADSITLLPTDSGQGPDIVDKTWLKTNVTALSGADRTARIGWSTQGLPFTQMVLTDPASEYSAGALTSSVYNAFDLSRIEPITPSTDPLIAGDAVTRVELYSLAAGDWVDITSAACAAGCTGKFPGYTLTTLQKADTLGVRITIGGGADGIVGSSFGNGRPLDLTFTLRDKLRSDPTQWVLGNSHGYDYNTGQPGLVSNTVRATGTAPGYTTSSDDNDQILIEDVPVNVGASKTFDQTALGLPQAGTAADDYPLITATLTGTNQTASQVQTFVIQDPDDNQAAPTAYDVLNLYQIDSITPAASLGAASATVSLRIGGVWTDYTPDDAADLGPAALADVTGVRVSYTSASGSIDINPGVTATITLSYQLRATHRIGGAAVTATPDIDNVVSVAADSPGRIPCEPTQTPACSTGTTTATDDFDIVQADYTVDAVKDISPTSRYEGQSSAYTTTLSGQPQGNARTVKLTLTDATATFWNTMAFTSASVAVPRPVNQAKVEVLTGVTFDYDSASNELTYRCGGSTDLSACWTATDWIDVTPDSTASLPLPGGISAASVRGVRYSFRQVIGGQVQQWERPFNPVVPVTLQTSRLANLRIDRAGDLDSTPVPTTRPGLVAAPGEPSNGTITNTLDVDGDGQFGPNQKFTDSATSTDTTIYRHLPNRIKVEKTPGSVTRPPTFSPDGTIPYVLKFTNTGSWPMTGLTISDQFATDAQGSQVIDPGTPGTYSFKLVNAQGATQPVTGFSASLNPTTGRLTVDVPAGFVFNTSWVLTVTANLKFRDGLDPATVVENTVSATSDRTFDQCAFTVDGATGAGSPTSNVTTCSAVTHVQPRAVAPLLLKKWVRGVKAGDPAVPEASRPDDLGVLATAGAAASDCGASAADAAGYYTYPCVPITRAGGIQRWRLDITNDGNVKARVVAAVDALPAPGDHGVLTSAARESQWRTLFRGALSSNVTALAEPGADLKVYWSTKVGTVGCNTNAISVHTALAAEDTGCAFGWQELTGSESTATLNSIRSLKFTLTFPAGEGIAPGETLRLSFDTQTPDQLTSAAAASNGLPIAYNSFGGGSRTIAVTNQPEEAQLPLEPTKVGVAATLGQLKLRKQVVAPSFSGSPQLPTSYPVRLTCTANGTPVDLVDSAGATASTVSLPANGTEVTVNSPITPITLPLFARCTVAETSPPTGATVSYDPEPPVVTALRDLSTNPLVNHPYTTDLDAAALKVTNTFTAGGFQVTKAADSGGAVDQDGHPVVIDEQYSFTASCQWEGQEVLAAADRTFSLRPGGTHQVTGVPTGAVCTVTEINRGAAASIGVTVTPSAGSSTTDNSATFSVGTGDATSITAAFTNIYATGALRITKKLDGPGAGQWGDQTFTLRTVCAFGPADPDTVYSATHDVSASNPVWQIDRLPAGAVCTVTEPATGGANDVQLPGPVTVEPSSQSTVTAATVTNVFDVGSLTVTKTVSGEAAENDLVQNGRYTLTLTCTRAVNGVDVPVTIPGGASQSIGVGGSHTWAGLPTGARCSVAETASDPEPQHVTITPAGSQVIGGGEDPAVAITVDNRFDVGYLRIVKEVTGPGAGFAAGASFAFKVVCTFGGTNPVLDQQVALTWDGDGGTVSSDVLGPVPVGSSCTATETASSGADTVPQPVTAVITAAATHESPVLLGFTNRYSAGEVEVTKKLSGVNADQHRKVVFTLRATCQLQLGDQRVTLYSGEVRLRGGQSVPLKNADGATLVLPRDTHCWLEEVSDGGADAVKISHGSWSDAAVVTASDSATPQQLTLSATNVFNRDTAVAGDEKDKPKGDNPDDGLPNTGGPWGGLIPLGITLLLVGGGVIWRARRRS